MDQVSPPLVIGPDDTWDAKVSHGNVHFSQTVPGSDKHFCFVKLCFCKNIIKPNIAFIFWGTGKYIRDAEKQAYKAYIFLF